jgi:hypothetical protein
MKKTKNAKKKETSEVKLFNLKRLRWAVEIEVEFPKAKDSEALINRHSVLKGWEIDSDGSLENGAEYRPKKTNKLYWNEESLTQLKEILALIRVHRGKVSDSCGLHIHINARDFTDKQVLMIIKEFVHKQRFIIKRFDVEKGRLDSMCQLLPKENITKLTEAQIHKFRTNSNDWEFNSYSYFDEKYYSLNIQHLRKNDYGTLEFRLFNATLNFRELKERIYWTLNFVKDSIEREE